MKMNKGTLQIYLPKSPPPTEISPTQVNLEDVEDFSNVCRICATVTELVIPIFNGEGLLNNLAEKIRKHLPIQVTEQDVLPLVVCYQCSSTILAWHELVQCSLQAEEALRTRLQVSTSSEPDNETETNIDKGQNKITKEEGNKFKEGTDLVVQTMSPELMASPPPSRVCKYCRTTCLETNYEHHLLTAHNDVMLFCKKCESFLDKRDFILHMSLHAVHNATLKLRPNQYKNDEPTNTDDIQIREEPELLKPEETMPEQTKPEQPNNDLGDNIEDKQFTETPSEEVNDILEDEFSDHSDMEYFGTLPESVFEAIEDTQDSQPTEDDPASPTPEHDRPLSSVDTNSTAPKACKTAANLKKSRTCPICSKVYTASSSYFYHMKYYHNENKEHECKVCGKKFGTKASLTQHAPIHTGVCQYECKECKKRFRSRASVYIHEQTHSDVKTWSCGQCERSFRWRTHMLRHMKRHSAERGHVCETCGRGFNVRCDLLRHARTHSAGKFACDKCHLQFAQLRYLKVHLRKKH